MSDGNATYTKLKIVDGLGPPQIQFSVSGPGGVNRVVLVQGSPDEVKRLAQSMLDLVKVARGKETGSQPSNTFLSRYLRESVELPPGILAQCQRCGRKNVRWHSFFSLDGVGGGSGGGVLICRHCGQMAQLPESTG